MRVAKVGSFLPQTIAVMSTIAALTAGLSCATTSAVPSSAGASGPVSPAAGPQHFVYVAGYNPTISILKLDPTSGALTKLGQATAGKAPSYLAFAPSKKFLYAVDETEQSSVIAYAIDPSSGALTEINRAPTGSAGACHLAVDPSGSFVITAHYDGNKVTVHALRPDGGIGAKVDDKSPGKNAHQAVFAGAGRFVFVPCLGSNLVAQYRFEGGKLIPNEIATVAIGGGPRHMVFDANERHAYVLSELENQMTSFDYDSARGLLSNPHTSSMLPPGGKKLEAAHLLIAGGGKILYATNREDNSLVIFPIDTASGRLGTPTWQRQHVDYVRDFTLDNTGAFLLIANQKAKQLTVFRSDPSSGQLTLVGSPLEVPEDPTFVGVLTL
jgi:6-phosphogluconolactonase